MSTFIQIPSSILNLKARSNMAVAYTYLLIRSQIKDSTNTASISEKQLANLTDTSESTIKRYIKQLQPYFTKVTLHKGDGKYPYNVYHLPRLEKDYSIVLPDLIADTTLKPEEKEVLLRIKMACCSGTNYIRYKAITTDLSSILGIGKNDIKKKLKALEDKGCIRFIGNSIHLTSKYFPLSLKNEGATVCATQNHIYETIYQYCLDKGVIPPLRDTKALGYIVGKYPSIDDTLLKDLECKCKTLPDEVSLDYFVKALENKDITRQTEKYTFTL